MKTLISSFCLLTIVSFSPKANLTHDQLCEHKTDGSGKSKGIIINLQLPCDWKDVGKKPPEQVFNFVKKNDELKIVTSGILTITDLPKSITSPSQINDFLNPEGLKTLSEGSGEIVSTKQLKINKLNGGQIIRKDATRNFF